MITLFQKAGLRYLFTHPWQTFLSSLGIMLGVAVILSIDIANESSGKAFDISMESVTGKTTHRLSSRQGDISLSNYTKLRTDARIKISAPVIEENVKVLVGEGFTATFLGLDPFSEKEFRNFISADLTGGDTQLAQFLSSSNTVLIPESFAREAKINSGDTLSLKWGDGFLSVVCVGLIKSNEDVSGDRIEQFIISDIETARKLFKKGDFISYIDLILTPSEVETITNTILRDPVLQLSAAEKSNETAKSMTEAFRLNLNAMSLLALIVGLFLIYNAMTFSVVQRRKLLALLRAAGVTQKDIFIQVMAESIFIASIGTIGGIIGGIFLGKVMLGFVTQSLNDLYFVTTVQTVSLSPLIILKASLAGVGGTIIAAMFPAYEAARTSPGVSLKRSSVETKLKKKIVLFSIISFALLVIGVTILSVSGTGILTGYFGIFLLIIAFALQTPAVITFFVKVIEPIIKKLMGNRGKIGVRGVTANMSRTSVAIAALAISVSATIGVSTMINSFRGTVVDWLEQTLVADVFVSSQGLVSRKNEAVLDTSLIQRFLLIEGVKTLDFYSEGSGTINNKTVEVFGSHIDPENESRFNLKEGNSGTAWEEIRGGSGVLMTETFAYKWKYKVGDQFTLQSPSGLVALKVSAIYYDYSSDVGHIAIDYNHFKKYWKNQQISGIGVYLKDNVDITVIQKNLRLMFPEESSVSIRLNKDLRDYSIEIFDRTFVVAGLLHILSVIVAFIGVFSALMSIQLEKEKEMGILRATGLTPGQMLKMISVQTFTIGLIAAIIAIPLGLVLAYCLIYIINLRSFGWTMQMSIDPVVLFQAIIIAVSASLLAGLYPAYKMSVTLPSKSLRDE